MKISSPIRTTSFMGQGSIVVHKENRQYKGIITMSLGDGWYKVLFKTDDGKIISSMSSKKYNFSVLDLVV